MLQKYLDDMILIPAFKNIISQLEMQTFIIYFLTSYFS